MQAKATAKFLRISPTKVAHTIDLIRGKPLEQAVSLLDFTPNRAARLIRKTLLSAAANAENNHAMNRDELWVKTVFAEAGPTMKRMQPGPRGMASVIRKRMSHLTLVLGDEEG